MRQMAQVLLRKCGPLLARPPAEISLLEVVEGCIGNLKMVQCLENDSSCNKTAKCATYVIWKELTAVMEDYLRDKTLASLAEVQEELDADNLTYYI